MKRGSTSEGVLLIFQKRNQAILWIGLAIVCIMILGISLQDLQFLPGLPIPGAELSATDIPKTISESSLIENSSLRILQIGLAAGVILIIIFLITALFKKVSIKLVSLLAGILVILFVIFSTLPDLPSTQLVAVPEDTYLPEQQLPEFLTAPIGDPPAALLFWVEAGLLLAATFFVGWIVVHILHQNQQVSALAVEAETAIQAIKCGENLSGVIIRCYLNMEKVVSKERGIDRDKFMTPREFQTHLITRGIPEISILKLTTLFEKVRYGNQCLTELDELDALSSLSAIQKACLSGNEGD